MLATASLPENSKASAGSREMMSSICLAMTTVSFGVCAKADGPPSANAKQVIKVGGRRISNSPPSFIELADAPVAGLYMLFISSQHTLGKRVDPNRSPSRGWSVAKIRLLLALRELG